MYPLFQSVRAYPRRVEIKPICRVLRYVPSGSNAEFDPSVADVVDGHDGVRQKAGVSISDAQNVASDAGILRLGGEIGELTVGACADLTVIQYNADAAPLTDAHNVPRPGGCWEAIATFRAGQIVTL